MRGKRKGGGQTRLPIVPIAALFAAALCLSSLDSARAVEAKSKPPVPPQVTTFVQEAQQSIAKGDMALGLIQLKNAVRLAPRIGEVRAQLGFALLKQGDGLTAMRELRQAIADGASEDAVVPSLLQAMLITGRSAELLGDYPEPPTGTQSKIAPDILIARGVALETLGRPEEAKAAMDRALTLRRDGPALGARAKLAAEQNDFALARRLADEAVKRAPDNDEVMTLQIALLHQEGRSADAFAQADAYSTRHPRSLTAKALRVEALMDLNRDAEASAEVEKLLAASPNFGLGLYYKASLAMRKGNAKAAWSIAQSLQPEFVLLDSAVAMTVAQMAVASGNLDTGRAILAAFVSRHPDATPARVQLASVQLRLSDAENALRTLAPLQNSGNPGHQALLAQAYIQLRRFGDAVNALEKTFSLGAPADNDFLNRELALSRLDFGDDAQAASDLEKLAARDPKNWAIAAPLIAALTAAGRSDEALAVTDRIAKLGDKGPLPKFYRGQVLAFRRNLAGADVAFAEAIAADPKFLPAYYYRAKVLIERGDPDSARRDLQTILMQDPANVLAYLGLAEIAHNANDDDGVRDLLARAIKAAPSDPSPRLALANFQFDSGRYKDSQNTINTLLLISHDNPEALALQGRVQFASGDVSKAIETFRALAAQNPHSAAAYGLLATALHNVNDRLAALDAARTAAALAPFSIRAQAALIDYAIAADRSDTALSTAQAYRAAHPGPAADVLFGDTLIRLKRVDEAKQLFEKSFRAKPDRLYALRLSQIAMNAGDQRKALDILSDWLRRSPKDFEIRRQYASLLLQTGDRAGARAQFEILLKERPEDPIVLNNLASILSGDDAARALSLAQLASKVAPRSSQIADTLGWLRYRSGDRKGAVADLERAHRLNAGDGEIGYHLAVALDASGRRADAKTLLRSIVSKNQAFAHSDAAEKLLASW